MGLEIKKNLLVYFVFIYEICHRRKNLMINLSFLIFSWPQKKVYDSVSTYNILYKNKKHNNIDIRGKYLQFIIRLITNLFLTLKASANFNGKFPKAFQIYRDVPQGCHLLPILFNISISDIFDKFNEIWWDN